MSTIQDCRWIVSKIQISLIFLFYVFPFHLPLDISNDTVSCRIAIDLKTVKLISVDSTRTRASDTEFTCHNIIEKALIC